MPREIIAQITQQVIESLRASGYVNAAPPVQPHGSAAFTGGAAMASGIADGNASSTPRPAPVNIPPSMFPPKAGPSAAAMSNHSFSPSTLSQPFSAPPVSANSAEMYGSSPWKNAAGGRLHTPPTPEKVSGSDFDEPPYFDRDARSSFSRTGNDSAPRDIPVRNKDDGMSPTRHVKENLGERYGDKASEAERPAPARVLSSQEETIVEKMWQPLFDSEGYPTVRLNQFLRGVALHMVRSYR
jgi:hypothetical protein